MNDEINYKNNPLHGVSLKNLLIEMVDHYGFEILFAYLNINCFKTKPTIESSVKFLKKTDWAREKVEAFYLYEYKNLPRASGAQYALSPRDRIVPEGQTPGEPAELSLEDAERLREKREKRAAEHKGASGRRSNSGKGFGSGRGGKPSHSRDRNDSDRDRDSRRSINRDDSSSHTSNGSGGSDPWARASRDSNRSNESNRSGTSNRSSTNRSDASNNQSGASDPWGNGPKRSQDSNDSRNSDDSKSTSGAPDPWGNWKK